MNEKDMSVDTNCPRIDELERRVRELERRLRRRPCPYAPLYPWPDWRPWPIRPKPYPYPHPYPPYPAYVVDRWYGDWGSTGAETSDNTVTS